MRLGPGLDKIPTEFHYRLPFISTFYFMICWVWESVLLTLTSFFVAFRVTLADLVLPDPTDLVETKEREGALDHVDHLDCQDARDQSVLRVPAVLRDLRVPQVMQEYRALLATQDKSELQ